jgi:predicted MFS family arabinose efflux permease
VNRRDVPNAIALNSIQFNLALVIGPVLAGLLMTSYGAVTCFGINGLSFLAAIASIYLVKSNFLPVRRKESVWEGIREGLRFVRARKTLWPLSVLGFILTFSVLPMTTLLPVYARDIFGLGSEGFAGMMTTSGLGAVVGALISANLGWMSHRGRFSVQVQVVLAVVLALFALSTNLYVGLFLLFLCRAGLMVLFSSIMSLVQEGATEEMRGRVVSIFNLAMRGGMPLGNLAAGVVASRISAPAALLMGSALLGGAGLYCLLMRVRVTRI